MKTQDIPVKSIDATNRRREDYGDIEALAAGIARVGLLSPILVDRAEDHYRLIFGGRRLRAVQKLKWSTIPAFVRDQMSDTEFREIELEENLNRKDLTDWERKRTFASSKKLVEQAKTAAEVMAHSGPKPNQSGTKGGRPSQPDSTRAIASALGTSMQSIERAEQHVETAEKFPFMQGNSWRQSNVLAVRESLEALPEAEHNSVVGVLACAKLLDPDTAVSLVTNIAKKKPEERTEVYTLSRSADPRDQSLALTKAAELPPMPDPRLGILDQALHFLVAAVKPYPHDPLTPRINEVIRETRAIRTAVKEVSFDVRRSQANGARAGGTIQ